MDEASRPLAAHGWARTPAVALRLTADRVRYRRRRWAARLLTAAVVVHQTVLVVQVVARATDPAPDVRATAAWGLYLLGVSSLLAGPLLWWAWRRVAEVRPVVLPLDVSAAAAVGVPELESEPGPHLGLSGVVEPPRRW